MEVRNRATGQVIFDHEFRQLYRHEGATGNIGPEYYTDRGYDIVFEGPQASGGTVYQYSMRQGVEQIEGKWYTKYVLGPIFANYTKEDGTVVTAAEQEAEYKARKDAEQAVNMRRTRTEKLKDCDWTQLADSPVDKAVWATYRQALRDVPTQTGFPWNVTWPTQPE
jgi:hypothetical protein